MNYFRILSYIFNFIISFSLFFTLYFYFKAQDELQDLKVQIRTQNALIEKQKLDLQSYICDLDSMKEYAQSQYKLAFEKTKNDKTCEGKLKHLESILKSYE